MSPKADNYAVHGQGNSSLVFIHGVGMNQYIWQPQIDYFSKNHQVIVYDLLGHGTSPMPSTDAQLTEYSQQLFELLDHLAIPNASIIGHSTGALISIEFTLQYPQRVNCAVPMNIVYQRSDQQNKDVLARANQVLDQNKVTGIDQTLSRWTSNKTDETSLKRINSIRQFLNSVNPTGYGRTYKMFALSDRVLEGRLDQLKIPVLYLTGDCDPNSTPKMSQTMAKQTPQGKSLAITDEAHMMAYISPEKINPVINQFLQENS